MTQEKQSKKEIVDLTKPSQERILGVDIGTMNIVTAEKKEDKCSFSIMRNMFLPLDKEQLNMAELSNIDFIESDEKIYIIGADAFNFSNIFGKTVNRPMYKGLVSPLEIDSLDVLSLIIEKMVGKTTAGKIIYGVPAVSVDMQNSIIYHEGILKRIFNNLGYYAESFNEAQAIIYSNCQENQFTGLAFSFGAGMVNTVLSYRSVPVISFSVARAGDWVDEQSGLSLNIVPNRITKVKECSMNLEDFQSGNKKERRIRECIVYYYREMIRYTMDRIKEKLSESAGNIELPESLSIVISGGTSMATGFLPLFNQVLSEYKDNFPIKIKDVRLAEDPMTAVAEGLLIKALSKFKKE